MFRKQNQRNARFSEIAEHSRRKEVTLYMGRDEQRPNEYFGVYRRPAVVATVVVFERLDEFLEVELLVYLDEKVLRVDKVSESLGRELKQRGVSAVAVQ